MSDPTNADLIARRAKAASPGPWTYAPDTNRNPSDGPTNHTIWDAENGCVAVTDYTDAGANDAEFITHAREDIPALLAALEQAGKELAEAWVLLSTRVEAERLGEAQRLASSRSTEIARLAATIEAVKAYADERAWYGQQNRTVGSNRIASDLHAILSRTTATTDSVEIVGNDIPYHLRADAEPLACCSKCHRSTWAAEEVGTIDRMPQPSGQPCGGYMTPRAANLPEKGEN